MSYHTYTTSLFHCVFATKNRIASIPEDLQPRLWAYMGGVARTNRMKALAVGGIADHAHILLSRFRPRSRLQKRFSCVKAGSSKWMHEQTGSRRFDWQEGYGAFTIGASQVPATIRYIDNQPRRHRKISAAEEWEMFLKRHAAFLGRD